ncbi:MAG: hypothetical protein ABI461_06120 [Polyangiaceae bacterium]
MDPIRQLLELIRPETANGFSPPTRTQRLFLSAFAFLIALALVAVWGIAAGTHDGHIAIANAVKVPMLLVVSSLTVLPLGLLVFRLTSRSARCTDLLAGHAIAIFSASLVLAVLSPLLMLYQFSSTWAGPLVAVASVAVAFVVGFFMFVRVLEKLNPPDKSRASAFAPAALLMIFQIAALAQTAAIAPPILPSRTAFGEGVDSMAMKSHQHTDPQP